MGNDEKSKDESNEEETVDDSKQERTIVDVGEDEINVGRKDEGSVEIKEVTSSEPFTEDLNRSGSERNDTTNDVEETAKIAKEEKPKPVKRGFSSVKD